MLTLTMQKKQQAEVQIGFYFVAQGLLEGCSITSRVEAGKASGCLVLGSISNLPAPI